MQRFARGFALVLKSGDKTEADEFKKTMDEAVAYDDPDYLALRQASVRAAVTILHRQLAIAELEAPASGQGTFIPAGNEFDAVAAFARVASRSKKELLVVDPYMDEKALTDFVITAQEKIAIKLLADEHHVKPSFAPSVARWVKQYGQTRPLLARLAPGRTLHDRLIMVDEGEVWIVTQSLNAIAQRAPASIVRVEGETAADKLVAYKDIWSAAKII